MKVCCLASIVLFVTLVLLSSSVVYHNYFVGRPNRGFSIFGPLGWLIIFASLIAAENAACRCVAS
jgi:hypothetical protein